MYSDVCDLGISYDNYWDMQPIEVHNIAQKYIDNKQKEIVNNMNNDMAMAWYTASLQGVAMNNPKKFPKKPHKYETEQDKIDKTLLLAYKLEAMAQSNKQY